MSTKESSWLFYLRIFDNFILANRLLAKDLRRFEACPSVNNNLCGKSVSWSELPMIFDDNLKFTAVLKNRFFLLFQE